MGNEMMMMGSVGQEAPLMNINTTLFDGVYVPKASFFFSGLFFFFLLIVCCNYYYVDYRSFAFNFNRTA